MARSTVTAAILLALGGLVWDVAPPAATAEVLTLEQAIALAGENNRLVKNSSLDVEKAAAQADATRTRRLPGFSFKAQANQLLTPIEFTFAQGSFRNFPATGPIPAQETKLQTTPRMTGLLFATISQPLLEQFSIKKNIELGELNREIATEQLRNQRQTVLANLKRTYFGLIQTQSSLESAEEAIRLYRELERLVKEQGTAAEVARSRSPGHEGPACRSGIQCIGPAEQPLGAEGAAQRIAGTGCTDRVHREQGTGGTEVNDPAETVLERALQQRPDVRQARLQVQQAEHDKAIKKLEYLPALDLTFNYISLQNVGQVLS